MNVASIKDLRLLHIYVIYIYVYSFNIFFTQFLLNDFDIEFKKQK